MSCEHTPHFPCTHPYVLYLLGRLLVKLRMRHMLHSDAFPCVVEVVGCENITMEHVHPHIFITGRGVLSLWHTGGRGMASEGQEGVGSRGDRFKRG